MVETRESYAQFLVQSGVPAAQAVAAADALIGRIITALGHGESPETAVASAKQDTEQALNQLAQAESAHPHQDVTAALAQGGDGAAEVVARTMAEVGGSPEARTAAAVAWQEALARGDTPDQALAHARAAGASAEGDKAAASVAMNGGDALVAGLSLGGPEAREALGALTAGMSAEQAAAFTKGLFGALMAGVGGDALMKAAHDSAGAASEIALAQSVPQSPADALTRALASGVNAEEALTAAGLGGNPVGAQALVAALAGGAGAASALDAAAQANQSEAATLAAASTGSGSALIAALAGGGHLDQALSAAGFGGGESQAGAMIQTLTQALAAGASVAAAVADAHAASDAAQSQHDASAAPHAAGADLAAALASGANVDQALADAGLGGDPVQAKALAAALASGADPAGALASAQQAGAAAAAQSAAAAQGVAPPSADLVAMAGGGPAAAVAPAGVSAATPATEPHDDPSNPPSPAAGQTAPAAAEPPPAEPPPAAAPVTPLSQLMAQIGESPPVAAQPQTSPPPASAEVVPAPPSGAAPVPPATPPVFVVVPPVPPAAAADPAPVDHVPVAVADVASATEAGGTANGTPGDTPTGNVLANDTDADSGDALTVSSVGGGGAYGALTLSANGDYSYVVDNANLAVQALASAGDTLTEVFTYTARDSAGLTSSNTLTVIIHGANDAPTVSAGHASVALVEAGGVANAIAGVAASSVTLTKGDVDGTPVYDAAWLTTHGWSTSDHGLTYTETGTYGVATLTVATNVVGYALSNDAVATEALTAGQRVSDAFTVRVTDGALTQTATAVFNVTGTNDAAVMSSATKTLTETNAAADLGASGTLTITDVDSPATFVAQTATQGDYGAFSIDAAGAWTYTASSAHDEFAAGTTHTDTFSVASADGTTTSVTVNIQGANDPAVLSSATVTLTETNAAADLGASGTLTITDVDSPATFVAQTATQGDYGAFSIDTAGAWTYTASSAHNEFAAGTTHTDSFSVASADGTTTSVTVNIHGTDDAPTLTSVQTLNGATENLPFTIGYAALAAAANAADVDGGSPSFRVEAVSSGTLTENGVAVVAGTTIVGAGDSLVWTPASGVTGTKDAFTITAYDGTLASAAPVQVQVGVASGFIGQTVAASGHVYQYFTTGGASISWSAAEAIAESSSDMGVFGHLATVTSAAENTLVSNLLNGADAWIGGTRVNGVFEWVDSHQAIPLANADPSLGYRNWNAGEPNNSNGTENSLEIYNSGALKGQWNDLSNTSSIHAYVIEYDIPVSDPPLPAVAENTVNPLGESIASLFAETHPAQLAVAVDSATSDQGDWQYSATGGATWTSLANDAALLNPEDLVRFLPAHNWNGTPGALLVGVIASPGGSVVAYDEITTSVTPVNAAAIARDGGSIAEGVRHDVAALHNGVDAGGQPRGSSHYAGLVADLPVRDTDHGAPPTWNGQQHPGGGDWGGDKGSGAIAHDPAKGHDGAIQLAAHQAPDRTNPSPSEIFKSMILGGEPSASHSVGQDPMAGKVGPTGNGFVHTPHDHGAAGDNDHFTASGPTVADHAETSHIAA